MNVSRLPLLACALLAVLLPGQGFSTDSDSPETQIPKAIPVAPLPSPSPAPRPPASSPAPAPLPPLPEREAILQVQIFLDRALFGPGKLDGLPGEFTTKAITYFQQANGLEATGQPDNLPLPKKLPLYSTYTLRPEDKRFVGHYPSKPADQAKKQYLPYESLAEFLTERFHCSPELLALLNPELSLSKLQIGDTVKVPNVEPFQLEDVRPQASLPAVPELLGRSIRINRKERILHLREGDKLLASLPITPGSSTLPTPPGKWRVVGITTMPTFRWDEGVLNHGVRTSEFHLLPPGPKNPVGIAWCALSRPGIGIHGTNQPQTIGRSASHGCMRVANWDVVRLIPQITAGIPVDIE